MARGFAELVRLILEALLRYYLRQKKMSCEEFIDEHIADIKYLERSKNLDKRYVDLLIVGVKARPGITVDDLKVHVALVRKLLYNLCPELFMDGCKTLQDFLKKNQHDIYHLFKFNQRCCQCSQDYKFPVTKELLKENQYKNMFESSPCTNCAGKSGTVCSVSSCKDTEYILLDYRTRNEVFKHFSHIFKIMQESIDENGKYILKAATPNEHGYEKDIKEQLMVLARICGNEDEMGRNLNDDYYDLDVTGQEVLQQLQKLTEAMENLKATETNLTKDPQSPMMGTSDEIKVDKELLSKGTFISYDNCVYLAGACNVGKSTLASILIGEEISQQWKSTDGLTIYFGRNGIDLKNKEMVPLKQDSDRNVLSKVIRGKPDMTPEKPDRTHREEVLPHDSNKGNIIPETHTDTQRTDITAPTPSLVPGTGKDDVNITDPVRQQSPQNYIITTIQEDIKEQIRKGTYTMDIAPSDLVDFGGQRSFDMTHQLFMRRKGTFVLMFNGSINFLVPLKEYEQGETTESILKHWVNSILSYCADDEDILPIIMFCATHSDDYQEDRIDRKAELIHNLRELFENHKEKHHIIYDEIFFINGKNKNDLEIKQLKSKLVEVAFKQESWGERVPMAWVPLDLQMSKMRRVRNVNIISKEELITLNQTNGDLALPVKEITNFLNVQHSLGKILYIDQHGLDHFIVVQPQSLVNILRSFITAEHFWPKDEELRGILCTLTNTGKIARQNLLKLWSQEKFHQHMPSDDLKEFIIQVLVHLDILVEPRHHRQEQESKVQSYLVPCIVKHRLPVTDFYVKAADKMISLSYTLLKSSIPAALSFKLIGAAINLWPLKKTHEGICLYHQAAILCIDESNDLHLLVEDDKVFVYLINKDTKRFISPNMASVVQECLTLTMTKVLEFYHKSFGKSLSTLDVSKAFEIKVGEWCTSEGGCYISVRELEEKTEWRCKNNKTHGKTYPRYWICNKKQVKCDEKCPGLDEKDLVLPPEDKHLFKLAKLIKLDECYNLVIKLGLTDTNWNDIQNTDGYDNIVKKYNALCKWKDLKYTQMSKPSFKELSDALAEDYHTHFLCQLFMEDVTVYEIANSALQEIPEDDVLQDLSNKVGNCAMHLGVELGLSMAAIEGILFKDPKNMFKQTFGVMKEWKSSSKVETTILILMKAFQSADGRGLMFLREKYIDNQAGDMTSCSPVSSSNNISTGNDQRGVNKRVHDLENKTGEEATQQVDMKTMKLLTEVSNSVGMFHGKIQGSCWRAGTDLIVTAWHVVRAHVCEYEDLNEMKLKEVKIKFDYTDSGDCDESNIFEVEPSVLYHNETLDTAILRLKPNDKVVTFPPPFRRLDHFLIPAEDEDLTIYLIGHPDGSPQRVNLGVGLWNPTEERMQSLETFCKDEGYEYGYAELDKTERLVVKCEFEHGASGCPGVVLLGDNQVYLVTMFLKGFPDFYYTRLFNRERKKKFPKSKLFQQGVNIEAIYEDLNKNPMYADIFEDIFKQNPPVNMGPSGIIPSENDTDGYQDCHDRVSTSTRPTSDEGTHHVTSPCEEEMNENVSTCTHPTTVERQGSQMVVSDTASKIIVPLLHVAVVGIVAIICYIVKTFF